MDKICAVVCKIKNLIIWLLIVRRFCVKKEYSSIQQQRKKQLVVISFHAKSDNLVINR